MSEYTLRPYRDDDEELRKFGESPFHKVTLVECGSCGAANWFPTYTENPDAESLADDFRKMTTEGGCEACRDRQGERD